MRVRTQLKEIASYSKGAQINGDELVDNGRYDYLNGGIAPSGKWNDYNTQGGTVTISEGGNSCGYVNYMRDPFWCGAHCYYLYATLKNTEYLYYMLKSQQSRLMGIRTGACMPNIKKADLGKFEVVYDTDETEQDYVVAVLKKAEAIITARQQELQKLDELIKARFVEMFGDSVSNPKGWKKEKAEKHIDLLSGYPFQSEQYVEAGVNICGGLIIMPQRIQWEECKHWPSTDGFADYMLAEGDIVMALDRPWISEGFKIAQIDKEHLPALLIQRTARIRSIDVVQEYLYYCFINGGFDKHSNVTGSLVPHISAKDIRSFEILLPPMELQNQFADFVKQIDKAKFVAQKALEEAQLLFDSLMQKYFG